MMRRQPDRRCLVYRGIRQISLAFPTGNPSKPVLFTALSRGGYNRGSPHATRIPPMAPSLEQVVKQLEDSGIVSSGKLEDFVPPKAHPKTVEELVAELVKADHLTKFQAQHVAAGKTKSLILGNYTSWIRSVPAAWGRCSRPSTAA